MNIILKNDEVIEDIIWGGFSLIQKKKGFKFGVDAYLLANFVNVRPNEKVLDIGTGTGIISLLLTAKKRNLQITAIDILPEMTEMFQRTLKLNGLENIYVINEDVRYASKRLGKGIFSLIVSNPPYFPVSAGEHSPDYVRAVARTELTCSLEDLVAAAAELLNYGGRFVFIHRPTRLAEIFYTLRQYQLEPKKMQLVFPYVGKEPNLVLIEARKNAGQELRILPPLIIYDEPGRYSSVVRSFFDKIQDRAK